MPIETRDPETNDAAGAPIGPAVIAECRSVLAGSLRKINHCLDQLADDDLWWRPHESHNSIQNMDKA